MNSNHSRGNGETLWRTGKRGGTSHNLTARQKLFVLEYMKDLNATQAAIRAGYSQKGAEVTGFNLLRNIKVGAEIQAAMNRRAQKIELTAEYTLRAIMNIAHFDPRALFAEDGSLKDIPKLDADTARNISGFDFVTLYDGDGEQKHAFGQLRKVRFRDSLRALELEGRHLKLFVDKVEHGFDESAQRILASKFDVSKLTEEQLLELASLDTGSPKEQG
jgi:phage terminase small subunit